MGWRWIGVVKGGRAVRDSGGGGRNNRPVASIPADQPVSTLEHALRQFGARLFEAAPGLITWIMLLAPALIPILFKTPGAPLVASPVLVFYVYWLIRPVTVRPGVSHT